MAERMSAGRGIVAPWSKVPEREPEVIPETGTQRQRTAEQLILAALRVGSTFDRAAAYAGIDSATLRRWRKRGELAARKKPSERSGTDNRYLAFCTALDTAMASPIVRAETLVVSTVNRGLPSTATDSDRRLALDASKFLLERRARSEYGRADSLELTGPDNGPIEHNVTIGDVMAAVARSRGTAAPTTEEGADDGTE